MFSVLQDEQSIFSKSILSQKITEFVLYKIDRILDKVQDKIQLEARLGGQEELIITGRCHINITNCSTEWFSNTSTLCLPELLLRPHLS